VDISAPPHHLTQASLTASIGKIPATTYHTTAERWYDIQVTGSKLDKANGLFKRVEEVTVQIDGSLAVKTSVVKKSTPIKHDGGTHPPADKKAGETKVHSKEIAGDA
jgi:hypothetical protein